MGRLMPLFALALTSCAVKTDLGETCTLVRRDTTDPTGKRSIPLKEADIKANKDFISFGATGCEDLVCVRDAQFVRPDKLTDPSLDALGYCSKPCVEGSTIGCVAAKESDKLSCRALVLDTQTLDTIKRADPVTYKKYFGETTSPFFCARSAPTSDGGI